MPTTVDDLIAIAGTCSQKGFSSLTSAVGRLESYGDPDDPPQLTRHLRSLIAAGSVTYRGREWNLSLRAKDSSYHSYLRIVDNARLSVKGLQRAKNPPSLLLTGPPGVGKSQLARNITDLVAQAAGGHLAFFKFTKQNLTRNDPLLEPQVEIPFWKRAEGWYDKMILAPPTMDFLRTEIDCGRGLQPRGEQLRELPRADVVQFVRLLTAEDRIGGIPQLKGDLHSDSDWHRYLGELDRDFTTGRRELSDLGAMLYRRRGDVTLVVAIEEFGELHMEQQHALLPLMAAMGPKTGEVASPVDPKCLMGGYMAETVMSECYNPRALLIATSNDDMPLEAKVRTRMEKIEMPSNYSESVYTRILLEQIVNAAVVHKSEPHRSASISELERDPAAWAFQSELSYLPPRQLHELLSACFRFQANLGAFIASGSKAGVTISEEHLEKYGCELGSLRNLLARDPKANHLFCRPFANTMSALAWRDFERKSVTDTGENIGLGLVEKIAGADANRDETGRKAWVGLLKLDLDASELMPEFAKKSLLDQLDALIPAIAQERELARNDSLAASYNREMQVILSVLGRDGVPKKARNVVANDQVAAWLKKESRGKFNADRLSAVELSQGRIMLLGLFRDDGDQAAALPLFDDKFPARDFTVEDMRGICRGLGALVLRDESACITNGNVNPGLGELVLPEVVPDGDHFVVKAAEVNRGAVQQLLNDPDAPETLAERLYPNSPGSTGVGLDGNVLASKQGKIDPGKPGPRASRAVVILDRNPGPAGPAPGKGKKQGVI